MVLINAGPFQGQPLIETQLSEKGLCNAKNPLVYHQESNCVKGRDLGRRQRGGNRTGRVNGFVLKLMEMS